jgi:transcriptional regulator GlxA family with amidase domain
MDPSADLWWRIETWLREDLALPRSLEMIAHQFSKSPATIARSSEAAVGQPPMKRLKQIRMSLARGLVMRSDLLLKQVASQVGYARVHEFSRDYRLAFGLSPRQDRQRSQTGRGS